MQKRYPPSAANNALLRSAELEYHADTWLDDCEARQHSQRTLGNRRSVLDKLRWFLNHKEHPECGTAELRQFLAYVVRGHKEAGGRWGNANATKPVKPATSLSYYLILHAFCAFLVEEGTLSVSPLATMKAPVVREDQPHPFTLTQVEILLREAQRHENAVRDYALILFLLDTGARASEVAKLGVGDADLDGKRVVVDGKGAKQRTLSIGRRCRTALWAHIQKQKLEPHQTMFTAERGRHPGQPLTRGGVGQIIRRLGRAAGITDVRASPHTLRHTFAIEFLRAGGSVFALQMLLGHESLDMVRKYVRLAQADTATQHKLASPADRLWLK